MADCLNGKVAPINGTEKPTTMCHKCYGPVPGFYSFCSDECKNKYFLKHTHLKSIDELFNIGFGKY